MQVSQRLSMIAKILQCTEVAVKILQRVYVITKISQSLRVIGKIRYSNFILFYFILFASFSVPISI